MKVFKKLFLTICLLTLYLISLLFPTEVIAANSYTSVTRVISVLWNVNGLPYSVQTISWVNINGAAFDNELRLDKFSVSGAIVNAGSYFFRMNQTHTNSDLYSGNTKVVTYPQTSLTYFPIIISSNWQSWDNYGEKNNCNKWFNSNYQCKTIVNSWWHSSDTFPANSYPTYTHNFYNPSSGWVNN